jgi:4-hydroxy-4-methyl-2-oxoglutarate aldolase
MAGDDLVEQFSGLDSSTVSDALDRLGLPTQVHGITPLGVAMRLCGRAHTLRYAPIEAVGGTVGDYIDDVCPGDILVLDNGGRLDCTVWGDLLTSTGHRRRVGGTVIDGVCRDINRSLELGYPVFSRGRWMRTGKDRVALVEAQGRVSVSGVPVEPGDIVLGDADGVVIVPKAEAVRVLQSAVEIDAAEETIRKAVDGGARLDEARRAAGYHVLQTPTAPPS